MTWRFGGYIWLGLLGIGLFWCSASAKASGEWSRLGMGLNGQMVSALVADPNDPTELAAISDGQLYTTSTTGLIWQLEETPSLVTAVAYDPAHHGRLWIGSLGSCLASREAGSAVWQTYGNESGCDPIRIVPTTRGVYYLNFREATIELGHLSSQGITTRLDYPGTRPFYLAASPSGRHIYVAGQAEIRRSDDDGLSWQTMTKPPNTSCCVSDLWANETSVWQLAYGRPYLSRDMGVSWTSVGPVAPNSAGIGRLAIHGDTPFFSMAFDGGSPADVVTQATDPLSGLGLGQFATALEVAGTRLIAATQDGVWEYGTVLPSAAKRLRPVIVVPGILGSWPVNHGVSGDLVLDPILHTYDGLLARLRAVGYSETDGTLVPFPYQWRQDNAASAQDLSALIARTKAACGCREVDIIAHSMGGLVARQYIESNGYRGDVARLVEIATPNEGSPNAYPVWEDAALADDSFGIGEAAMAHLFVELVRVEGLLKHYASVIDYMRDGLPSIGQLLPDADYLDGRSYPTSYPMNHFLEALNTVTAIDRLQARVGLFVVGGEHQPTITSFNVGPPSGDHGWPDGAVVARGLGEGDGTVPQTSLAGIGQVNALFPADHGAVVTVAADRVIAYLLGDVPDDAYKAAVPQAKELATAVAKAPAAAKPKRAALVYTASPATLHVSKSSTTSTNQVYDYSDENGSYLIVTPPDATPTNPVEVTVTPGGSSSTPITVVQTDDTGTVTTTTATLPAGGGETDIKVIVGASGPGIVSLGEGALATSTSLRRDAVALTSVISARSSPQARLPLLKNTSTGSLVPALRIAPQRPFIAGAGHTTPRTLFAPVLWPIWIVGLGLGILIWSLTICFWRRGSKRSADRT